MPKQKKQSIGLFLKDHIFDITTLIISLVALVISTRSCTQAERSLGLVEEEFVSQRLAIWKGTIDEEAKQVSLTSMTEGIDLQLASVYFPPQLDASEHTVSAPNYSFPLTYLSLQLENLVIDTLEPELNHILVGENKYIPIVIKSIYVAQGNLYEETALYYIKIMIMAGVEGNEETSSIFFESLLFGNRLDPNIEIQEYLQNEWNNYSTKDKPTP